ncbi:hypothetical protein Bpfe_028719 [Biomphalaria pfeifferi]|uniref:Uncharacterized protein n=1 Tax=Biomphalaria pfeifferi TaxID=112525 RepID=A0AAD8EWN9_BIOPF|nr:hypothetical protein Bpfe_028719 [Biomphalaria pfeifferi]
MTIGYFSACHSSLTTLSNVFLTFHRQLRYTLSSMSILCIELLGLNDINFDPYVIPCRHRSDNLSRLLHLTKPGPVHLTPQ